MAVKGYFLDNESYSAHDVNRAFSCLTTEGVNLFSDTGMVTSDLNLAISCLTDSGVDRYNLESCKVYKSGESYMVKKGICFLKDGAFVEVDDEELIINPESGKHNYVYAMHDVLKNECTIFVSQSDVPSEALLLAEIDEKGKITDKRIFAQTKMAVPTANIMAKKTISLTFPEGVTKDEYTCSDTVYEVGFGGFNFVETQFENDIFRVYIGDGKKVEFLDGVYKCAWVKKEGSNLVITAGTWGKRIAETCEIELLLF